MKRHTRICLVVIGVAHAGCRVTSNEPAAIDTGSVSDGGGGADEPDAGIPARSGDSYVTLDNGATMSAAFWPDSTGAGSCTREEVGGCTLSRCEGTPEDVPLPDAGSIAIATADDEGLLQPDAEGRYPLVGREDAVSWTAGQQIHIDASGGAVPAFELALDGPGEIEEILAPLWGIGDFLVVSRAEPLQFEWTGPDEYVAAFVLCRPGNEVRLQVRCPFADGSRSAAISSEALSRLPAGCPEAFVALTAENRHYLEAGDYLVKIAARGRLHGTQSVLE
jgi:hypothetical protein